MYVCVCVATTSDSSTQSLVQVSDCMYVCLYAGVCMCVCVKIYVFLCRSMYVCLYISACCVPCVLFSLLYKLNNNFFLCMQSLQEKINELESRLNVSGHSIVSCHCPLSLVEGIQ